MSSFEAMRELKHFRFGAVFRQFVNRNDLGHLTEDFEDPYHAPGSNVNRGQTGHGKSVLTQHLIDRCDQMWKEVVQPVSGSSNYKAFREAH